MHKFPSAVSTMEVGMSYSFLYLSSLRQYLPIDHSGRKWQGLCPISPAVFAHVCSCSHISRCQTFVIITLFDPCSQHLCFSFVATHLHWNAKLIIIIHVYCVTQTADSNPTTPFSVPLKNSPACLIYLFLCSKTYIRLKCYSNH